MKSFSIMDKQQTIFSEERYFLKESLKEWGINEKTYNKLVKRLNKKDVEIQKNRKKYNFRHSKSMKFFLSLLFFIIVGILFLIAVHIWVWVWGAILF